jgi:hypothetical protein
MSESNKSGGPGPEIGGPGPEVMGATTLVLGDFLITRQWVYGKALGNAAAMRRN